MQELIPHTNRRGLSSLLILGLGQCEGLKCGISDRFSSHAFFCICYYGINKLNHLSKGTGESRYEKQWKEIIGYIVLVMKIMLYLEGIKNSRIV